MLDLAALQNELKTQDNAITADPLFVVYERVRIYGMDPNFGDESNLAWVNTEGDYEEADGTLLNALNRYYRIHNAEPRGWRRVHWIDRDKFATACLTRIGAEEFLRRNRHNLRKPHIFVESMYRNEEMKKLRNAILSGDLQVGEVSHAS